MFSAGKADKFAPFLHERSHAGDFPIQYDALAVCVYERYTELSKEPNKPVHKSATLMLRCVCNKDLCNVEQTFDAYLSHVRTVNE